MSINQFQVEKRKALTSIEMSTYWAARGQSVCPLARPKYRLETMGPLARARGQLSQFNSSLAE